MENITNKILGRVDSEKHKEIISAQNKVSSLAAQLGFLELTKNEMIQALDKYNKDLQFIVLEEAKRLGVEQGQEWHITQDGIAILGKATENI